MKLEIGKLRDRIRIERPIADEALDGAGSGTWELFGEAWAEIEDRLPSRGEVLDQGATLLTRPARVRMRYRTDITGDMRFVAGARQMSIVSGPAVLGNRDGIEFMVAEYLPSGSTA